MNKFIKIQITSTSNVTKINNRTEIRFAILFLSAFAVVLPFYSIVGFNFGRLLFTIEVHIFQGRLHITQPIAIIKTWNFRR
jgi:hypothetical protein